jgi:hypothetical protein
MMNMAIPRTSGERPRQRASIPAGSVATGVPGKAITVDVPAGSKARLLAGQDVEAPAPSETGPERPQRLGGR